MGMFTRRQVMAMMMAAPVAAQSVGRGRHTLGLERGRDGLIYVPRGYDPGVPTPLVLYLHGAGGSSESAASSFELADDLGLILLAPDARDWTWDALLGGFGPDVDFLYRALEAAVSRCSIDPSRMAMAGVSDGASYALSLGIGQGDAFGHLIAFSPGVMRPIDVRGRPRIFIAHGRADRVMPIETTSRQFVTRLQKLGYEVTFREYDGGHSVPPAIRREGFEWFVRASVPSP